MTAVTDRSRYVSLTGEPGQNGEDKAGQDSSVRRAVDKIAKAGLLARYSWDRTARIRWPGQDSWAGKPVQDSWNTTAREDSQDSISKIGNRGQDCKDRTLGQDKRMRQCGRTLGMGQRGRTVWMGIWNRTTQTGQPGLSLERST